MYHRKDDAEHNHGLEGSARNTGWMGRPGGRVPGGVSAFNVHVHIFAEEGPKRIKTGATLQKMS